MIIKKKNTFIISGKIIQSKIIKIKRFDSAFIYETLKRKKVFFFFLRFSLHNNINEHSL